MTYAGEYTQAMPTMTLIEAASLENSIITLRITQKPLSRVPVLTVHSSLATPPYYIY